MNQNRKTAYLAALSTAIIWGAAFPIVKPALDFISAQQFLFLRYALASLFMLPILVSSLIKQTFPFKHLKKIIGFECISMIVLLLVYSGLDKTSAIQASFIISTKPIFVTLAGIFILRESEEHHELIGLILSAVGTAIVIGSPIFFGQAFAQSENSSLFGNLLIIGAIIIEVFYLMKIKNVYAKIDKSVIIATSTLIGTIFFAITNAISGTLPTIHVFSNWQVILAVGYMGILGTALATTLNLKAYSLIEASEVVLFEYLGPLIAIPLSVWWLKDQVLPTQIVGLCIIGLGVYIAEKRTQKSKKQIL